MDVNLNLGSHGTFDENITRSRQEELQRNQDAINELDQILRQDALKQSSATRIQSAVRNHNALNESIKRAEQKMTTKENTASKISKQTLDDAMNEIVNEDAAATTISSVLSGHKGRKQFKLKKEYPIIAEQRKKQVENMTKVSRLQDTQPPSYKYNLKSNIDTGNIPYTGKIPKPSKNVMTASNLPQPAAFNTKEYTDKIYIRDMENKAKELTKNNFKKMISSGEIEAAATKRENRKAAATLQNAMRRKTDMMKKRQLVGEE